jgi:2-keto-4-pentenoate hydratase/2-oxohepta-3-ene-1,7-dioic acid hydratase in catechol pathway
MRICNFTLRGEPQGSQRAGLVEGSTVFELTRRRSLPSLLEAGVEGVEREGAGHPLAEVTLYAPLPRPGKILATIVNTRGMLGGKDVTLDRPRLDMKAPSAVVGPGAEILAPKSGIRPEVELAAIIGKRVSNAARAQAGASIFGYTVLNDVTAPADSREDAYEAYRRDKSTGEIRRTTLRGPLFRSKNHDTFCPMGPWVCTPDDNTEWSDLRMTTKFDGRLVQDGSTSEYIFDAADIASYVSQFLSLEPGDVVSCGSVGWTTEALGRLDPTEFVLPSLRGTLELEIEELGVLVNPVVTEA